LLDEPLEGLAPIIAQELVRVIGKLRADAGLAIIVVEQHARVALSLTEHAIVIDRGRVVHRGNSSALAAEPETLRRLLMGEAGSGTVAPPGHTP
jgi:branched-chain amino acid transport system ATP-binding protein